VGGIQAAVGTTIRNEAMAEKGFDKMSQEDERLAAKKGSEPVGAGQRGKIETVGGEGVGNGTGVGGLGGTGPDGGI
jgi:hypothetical protein